MGRMVEIRSYALKSGAYSEFDRLVLEQSLPMLARWRVDVVSYGRSRHDDRSCYLIRAYESLEQRQASQDAFYGSVEWNEGPRDAILALIEGYTTVILEMDEAAIEALRSGIRSSRDSRPRG
jgi:hypothetical protein